MRKTLALSTAAILSAAVAAFVAPSPLLAAEGHGHFVVAADPGARAQAMVDKGVEFLRSQQKPDGAWHGERMPPAITAIVLRAIVLDGKHSAKDEFVRKGYRNLLTYQLDSGGIYKDMLANYNTAIAVSSLAAAKDPEFKDEIDKAVAYLKDLQWTDEIADTPKGQVKIDPTHAWYGGAGYGNHGRPDGSNTNLMIEALHDAGLPQDDPAYKAAMKFVSRMQNLSETNDQPWAGNDGGAVYTPANNGESFAGEYTGPDGKRLLRSYGSMTYAMLKSYIYAGLSKDDPRVKAAWDWVRKNWTLDENPGIRAGNPDNAKWGMYYYYLTLARALHAYGQPAIVDPQDNRHDWRVELIDKLGSLQNADGSWKGDAKWMEDNPVLVTAFAILALEEARDDLKLRPAK